MLLQKILDAIFPNQYYVTDQWQTMDTDAGDCLGIYTRTRVLQTELETYYKAFDPDIIIFRTEDGKYRLQQWRETFAGSYYSPPEGDYFEFAGEHDRIDVELATALVNSFIEEIIQETALSYEMEKSYNEDNEVHG